MNKNYNSIIIILNEHSSKCLNVIALECKTKWQKILNTQKSLLGCQSVAVSKHKGQQLFLIMQLTGTSLNCPDMQVKVKGSDVFMLASSVTRLSVVCVWRRDSR